MFFLIILVGCNKEKIECNSTKCYYRIWETLFKSRNNISEKYFKEHVTVTKTERNFWIEGESIRVTFNVKIDWATIENQDQFIIKINSNLYPSLAVNRYEYLSLKEINQVLDNYAFSSDISTINADYKLKYSSKIEAMKALQGISELNDIEFKRIYYKSQKPMFDANGHPYLFGNGVINQSENKCIYAEIDLITGEGEAHEDACWRN